MGAKTFSDLSTAQKMRDWVTMMVEKNVARLRPPDQFGTVLSVLRTGPAFQLPEDLDAAFPAPNSPPGAPQQVDYATVRLDNGEIVSARVAQDIPVIRSAAYYDLETETVHGDTESYWLISEGVYRKKLIQTIVDPVTGANVDKIVPDTTLPPDAPYAPPRVVISGQAGKYVITQVIRGIIEYNDGVNLRPQEFVKAPNSGIRVHSDTITWYKQGWVGNTAFKAGWNYEAEINYWEYTSKCRFDLRALPGGDNAWHYIEPYWENPAGPGGSYKLVLLVYRSTSGNVFFYVARRHTSTGAWSVDDNFVTNTSVTIRQKSFYVTQVAGESLPGTPLTSPTQVLDISNPAYLGYMLTRSLWFAGTGGNITITSTTPGSPTMLTFASTPSYDPNALPAFQKARLNFDLTVALRLRTIGTTVAAGNYCWGRVGWKLSTSGTWNWQGSQPWFPGTTLSAFEYATIPLVYSFITDAIYVPATTYFQFAVGAYCENNGTQYYLNSETNLKVNVSPIL